MKTREIRRHQKAARNHLRILERQIGTARMLLLDNSRPSKARSYRAFIDKGLDRYLTILDLVRCWELEIRLKEGRGVREPVGPDS